MSNLAELAELIGGELIGDPTYLISGIDEIQSASSTDISFIENAKYKKFLSQSKAGAIILQRAFLPAQLDKNYLVHPSPSRAFQKLIAHFRKTVRSGFSGIHPTAVIHPTATIHDQVEIAPYVVIDANVTIHARTQIGAGAIIEADVVVGEDCRIHPKCVIHQQSQLGKRVIIQSGAIIGSCGFGYHTDGNGVHHPYEHFGNVILEDDVEIGANTTIDRARFKSTRIGRGTKIDNLVQIAHQVQVGEYTLIVAQVGIAGSTKVGNHCIIGGQVGIAGHITLADRVVLTARAAVSKTLDKADVYYGQPAMPDKEFKRHFLALRRVEKMVDRFKKLEKHFAHLIPDDDDSDD